MRTQHSARHCTHIECVVWRKVHSLVYSRHTAGVSTGCWLASTWCDARWTSTDRSTRGEPTFRRLARQPMQPFDRRNLTILTTYRVLVPTTMHHPALSGQVVRASMFFQTMLATSTDDLRLRGTRNWRKCYSRLSKSRAARSICCMWTFDRL